MTLFVNALTFGCCALIVVLGIYFGLELRNEYRRLNILLSKLLEAFPAVGTEQVSQQLVVDQMNSIAQDEPEISNAWSLYRRQWFSSDLAQQICGKDHASSKEACEFFNPSTIFENNRNWNLYRAMPSVLTGLGILFTFIGLTIGIAGVDGFDDPEGLKQLLGGASLAFCTSIAGLLCSILFTGYLKKFEHMLSVQLVDVVTRMDWVFPIISTQQLNASTYTAINQNSEVASLLNDAIRDFGEKSKDQASSLITALVNEFSNQLKDEVRNIGVVFSQALQTSISELEKTVNDLSVTIEKTSQSRDSLNQELEVLLSNYRALGQKIQALDVSFENHTTELDRILRQTEGDLMKVKDQFKQVSTDQANLVASNTTISQQVATTVTTLNTSLKGFDASLKSAEDMLSLSKDCIQHLNSTGIPALKEMENNLRDISLENQKAVQEYRNTSVELAQGAENLRQQVVNTMKVADKQLAGAISILSKAVKDWGNYQQESVQNLNEAVERLDSAVGTRK